MLPIQKKGKTKNFTIKPFPHDITLIDGYWTGCDVEVFDQTSVKALLRSCFGLNSKPRQMVKYGENDQLKVTESEYKRRAEWKEKFTKPDENSVNKTVLVGDNLVPDPFSISKSIVLFIEEAFFLNHDLNCLQILNLDDQKIQTDDVWIEFCKLKETFVECYVSYMYLKSKNWVIKSGIKFGGDFCEYE